MRPIASSDAEGRIASGRVGAAGTAGRHGPNSSICTGPDPSMCNGPNPELHVGSMSAQLGKRGRSPNARGPLDSNRQGPAAARVTGPATAKGPAGIAMGPNRSNLCGSLQ